MTSAPLLWFRGMEEAVKYALFGALCLVLVPVATWMARASARGRGWVLAAMIASTCVTMQTSIHLMQRETYQGTDHGFVLCVTDLLALSLCAALAMKGSPRLAWVPYNGLWMLALFSVACLSTVGAVEPEVSLYTLLTMLRAFAVYWAVVNCVRTGTPAVYVLYGGAAAALLVTAKCAWQIVGQHLYRVSGFFVHSNTLPSYLLLLLPSMLLLGLCERRLGPRATWAMHAGVLGSALVIVKTQSRAGIVVLALCVLATLALAWVRAPSRRVRLAALAWVIILGAGALWMARGIAERFHSAPPASALSRLEYGSAARLMAEQHVFGVGLNNYSFVLSQPDSESRPYKRGWVVMADAPSIGVAHDIYLLTAAETGLPGLLVFLIVVTRFLGASLLRGSRQRSIEALTVQGLALGMACCLAIGKLEWVMRQTAVMDMYAVAAGLAVGLFPVLAPRTTRPRPPVRVERPLSPPPPPAPKIPVAAGAAGGSAR